MKNNFKFRYYPTEELLISRIDKKLNQYERKVRRYLMNYTINNVKAFNLNEKQSSVDIARVPGTFAL